MTKFIQLCLFLCWLPMLEAQSILYVKSDATGTNNGSSWTNAFTSLDAALAAAQPGSQIWVAKGTYKPGNPTPNNSFFVPTSVAMYGGFDGVETSLAQRNVLVYETILNGDILGNDIPGNLLLNRDDNVLHVVRVAPGANVAPAVIDGFTIKNGQTLLDPNATANDRRGAGILVEGKAIVRNCFFSDNKAESGGSVMAYGAATNGLEVYNCRFENNEGTVRAAGVYFFDLNGASVRKCTFKNNKTVRGCVYPRTSINVEIDSCLFESNTNALGDGYGTGIFNWQCSYVLSNSQFINNTGGNGVGIYNDNRERGKYVEIINCLFEGNSSTDYGGTAIFNWQADHAIENCVFRNNLAPSSGAAIYNSDTTNFIVTNSTFEGHSGNFAAAIANYGTDCRGTFENCTFRANVATGGGGAVSNGFEADVTYKNCTFQANTADFGGAIFTQNDGTKLTIQGGLYTENGAETLGGAIFKNPNIPLNISGATFTANSAENGATIHARGAGEVVIENSIFTDNLALTQGAIDLLNVEATVSSCLMARNLNLSAAGAGGALINNASDSLASNVNLLNCTIADNLAPIGAGVAQYEDEFSGASMTMQNCLLQNPDGQNYGIESGAPDFSSNGGNQSSDDSMLAELDGPKDLSNTTNNFVNPDNGDYHLVAGTAAINGGVAAGAPTVDLEGNPRIGDPDAGAYEFGVSSVFQPGAELLQLDVMPNPSAHVVQITLENAQSGAVWIQVIQSNGQVLRTLNATSTDGRWQYTLPVNDLPVGNYRLLVRNGNQLYQTQLGKI